jgi:hypothetical protein
MSDPIRVEISGDFLELCATGTLIGAVWDQVGDWPDAVVLVFPQTSLNWRQRNNGPQHYVMPEFTPMCLVEDVLILVSRGVTVTVEQEDMS